MLGSLNQTTYWGGEMRTKTGHPLEKWMIENRKSLEDVASLIGKSLGTVRNLVRGKNIAEATLQIVSAKTGIDMETLRAINRAEPGKTQNFPEVSA